MQASICGDGTQAWHLNRLRRCTHRPGSIRSTLSSRRYARRLSDFLGNCDPAVIRRPGQMSRDCGIVFRNWSGARDLNPGPHGPEPCALPNCASPRRLSDSIRVQSRPGFRSSSASPLHLLRVIHRHDFRCTRMCRPMTASCFPPCRRHESVRPASMAACS
jgi:hypothetical protein